MTDNNQPAILTELRQLAASGTGIDEQAFRRLMLATMADIYERVSRWDEHVHPETEEKLKALEARDWRVIITSVIAAATAAILAYFAPHK